MLLPEYRHCSRCLLLNKKQILNNGNMCVAGERNLNTHLQLSAWQWLMSAVILYRWGNVISGTHKIKWNRVNRDLFSFLILLLGTYIQCGHIWHRNKLSRCQLEPLVSCSNDEHQTSLKWDRSSHPFASECRVSHTLRL